MKTIKGYSLLVYEAPDHWSEKDGIILPSAATMRDYLRMAGSKTFDVDNPPPDICRWGRYVSGKLPIPEGAYVYYNKHDADEFEAEGTTYVRINNLNALAYYVPEKNTAAGHATGDQMDA